MNELIKIEQRHVGDTSAQTVNARDLHTFLSIGKVFAAWIQERIEQYGFTEHRDFEVFSGSGNNPAGGRPTKEYALSLDMAKELAMVERNEKGKQARQYFIECERRAKEVRAAAPAELSRLQLIQLAMQAEQERLALETRVGELEPKAAALDRLVTADGSYCLRDAASLLKVPQGRFITKLNQMGWIYRRAGGWQAHQDRIAVGAMEHKITTGQRTDGTEWCNTQARVTAKGMVRLERIFVDAPVH